MCGDVRSGRLRLKHSTLPLRHAGVFPKRQFSFATELLVVCRGNAEEAQLEARTEDG